MEDKALGLLGLMRRARAVEIGTDSACDTVNAGKAKLLLLSADAADNARRKAENAANGRRVSQEIQSAMLAYLSAVPSSLLSRVRGKGPATGHICVRISSSAESDRSGISVCAILMDSSG